MLSATHSHYPDKHSLGSSNDDYQNLLELNKRIRWKFAKTLIFNFGTKKPPPKS